jgi:uncharacterized integral membrane protein (TIGR00698 family)
MPPPTATHAPAPAAWRRGLSLWLIGGFGALLAIPWSLISPPLARYHIEAGLALGIALALSNLAHTGALGKRLSRTLIQLCVVLLGFRMDLHEVARAGLRGLAFAGATILFTFALGAALARLLRTDRKLTTLLSSGTAICGGSAIAAVSTVIRATPAQVSIATATVFILNGAALYLFPILGRALHLSPEQFGMWAGVAIHDISSVVGAAQTFDATQAAGGAAAAHATDTATIVKLSRVIWIAPVCLAAGWWFARREPAGQSGAARAAPPIPWFVVAFLLAAAARTLWPDQLAPAAPTLLTIARSGMALALFLIGAALSRRALAEVGWRPLALGVILWLAIAAGSLAAILAGASA